MTTPVTAPPTTAMGTGATGADHGTTGPSAGVPPAAWLSGPVQPTGAAEMMPAGGGASPGAAAPAANASGSSGGGGSVAGGTGSDATGGAGSDAGGSDEGVSATGKRAVSASG